jgi:hypothetical protein
VENGRELKSSTDRLVVNQNDGDPSSRTNRDAPTGHKLFKFISFSFQSRRWAHIKRSLTRIPMITPTPQDIEKLHTESLQLRNQQFYLGTLALAGSGLTALIAPAASALIMDTRVAIKALTHPAYVWAGIHDWVMQVLDSAFFYR